MLVLLVLCALPAAVHAAGSAYVTNQNSNDVSQYSIGAGGKLSPLSPATVAAGSSPDYVAVTPDGKSAYVTNYNDNDVSQYSIDPLTGALSPKTPATVAAGVGALGVAFTPDGQSAYVVNRGDGTVSQYSIDPGTGALSPKTPATVAAGAGAGVFPAEIAVTPDGKSAYVTADAQFSGIGSVWQYSIDPVTGALSPKTPASVAAVNSPVGVAVTPDGKSAYVANSGYTTVSQYSIDPGTGALSPKTPATVASDSPYAVAVTPDGKSAYVTASNDDIVSQYSIDPVTGALSPKSPATVVAGTNPEDFGVAVTPDGKSAYVTNFYDAYNVGQHTIDPLTGTLGPNGGVAAGMNPTGIAVSQPLTPYARPRGATPMQVFLVPAYKPCTSPNETHGAPLSFGSCSPPAQASGFLTVGTPDSNGAGAHSIGSVLLSVKTSAPADLLISVSTTDVRCQLPVNTTCGSANAAAGPDYTGELRASLTLRITDRDYWNFQPSTSGTTVDKPFPVTVPCAATADTSIGSTCAVSTSANAVVPGSVKTGKRAIWEMEQLQVYDGGASGTAGSSDATLFMDEGVFVP